MTATASNPKSKIQNPESDRLFTFASGGWVILLTSLLCAALIAWAVAPAIMRQRQPPGDGATLESFKFDLSNLSVPRDLLAPAMLHRGMVPVMTGPTFSGPDASAGADKRWRAMQRRNDPKYGKYLVASDHIIGVTINGESRAYPLHVLYVHEIINDTLGDTPIAVTYHWPCASARVFDRRIAGGGGERIAEFAVSGLVYNSNLLMFDRSASTVDASGATVGGESLYSQLLAKAISGDAAARAQVLTVIPCELVSWSDWIERHPDTTVVDRDLRMFERYKDAAPTQYFKSERLVFPVKPLPSADSPDDALGSKTRVLAVETDVGRRVYPVAYIINHATPVKDAPAGLVEWRDRIGSHTLLFIGDRRGKTIADWTLRVEINATEGEAASDTTLHATNCFWFAWHAMHPDDEVVRIAAEPGPDH